MEMVWGVMVTAAVAVPAATAGSLLVAPAGEEEEAKKEATAPRRGL
jgi:hypothetical protein